jgi:transcriptional regulator GlxA family with amidase domain
MRSVYNDILHAFFANPTFIAMTTFNILLLAGAYASSVALTVDILSAAASIAPGMKLATPQWKIYSMQGSEVLLSNGMKMPTQALAGKRLPKAGVWLIPGIGITSAEQAQQRLAQPDAIAASTLLAKASLAGVGICASCSAVLLLAQAGLLVDRRVTTAWWLAPLLQQREPRCQIDANRMIITDGSITTAGAALAQTDLMLHLLREHFGIKLADAVARVLLIDKRQSQAGFILPSAYASGSDLVTKLSARFEASLPTPPNMQTLAQEMCMSERSLSRHIRAATGRNPLALLQSIRIHKAQALLQNSRLSVDEIAERVGYQDATALRRLLKATMQSTPRQIRQHADLS